MSTQIIDPVTVAATRHIIAAPELCLQGGFTLRTLRRWENDPHDPLPVYRPGGWQRIYIIEEVIAWLQRHRTHPANRPASRNPNLAAAQAAGVAAKRRRAKAKTARAAKN